MDTLKIYDELKNTLGEEGARAVAKVIGDLYESNLAGLREGFEKLMESHRQAQGRLDRLERAVQELTKDVRELAEAQRKTEQKVEELAEAQRRTEQKVEELAEAQRKTEEELRKLARAQREMRAQLGGLAHTVGYRLEDEAFKALPSLLKRDMGVQVVGRLKRDYIEVAPEKYLEVNILGKGIKEEEEVLIIGEAKSQLRKRDVDRFIKKCQEVSRYVEGEQLRVLVTYQAPPQVQRYVSEKGIKLYFSYDF